MCATHNKQTKQRDKGATKTKNENETKQNNNNIENKNYLHQTLGMTIVFICDMTDRMSMPKGKQNETRTAHSIRCLFFATGILLDGFGFFFSFLNSLLVVMVYNRSYLVTLINTHFI